jgi:hypothetical protein
MTSLVTSFSRYSLLPEFVVLSIKRFIFVPFSHLILLTASLVVNPFVSPVHIKMILSRGSIQASKAGEPFNTSSTWI